MVKVLKGTETDAPSHKSNTGRLDSRGRELLDGRPMEPPVGYVKRPSLTEQIRAMVREHAFQQALEANGVETFEEAEDFDIGDDYDPSSPYEEYFEPTPNEALIQPPAQKPEPPREPPSGGAAQAPAEQPK